MHYFFLAAGIISELFGSIFLKVSDGFRKKGIAVLTLFFYFMAYYLVAISMRVLPLNVAYATWCGAGTLMTVLIGRFLFHEKYNLSGYIGVGLLVCGIIVLNLYA